MRDHELLQPSYEIDHQSKENTSMVGGAALAGVVELQQAKEKADMFDLTTPESRTYSPYESYQFLVHVALNGVETRANEIGTDRSGKLMTSLVSNMRAATFNGEGGIIVAQPPDELVTGIAAHDIGGENIAGTREPIANLRRAADNSDYSQVDMTFNATKPVGVMIKRASTDGHELGSAQTNKSLREYAEANGLPVAEVIVLPDEGLPTETSYERIEQDDGSELVTVILPDTKEQYYKVQVLHGEAYHMREGENTAARTMKITAYGETVQTIDEVELNKILTKLEECMVNSDGVVTNEDAVAVKRDALRLLNDS